MQRTTPGFGWGVVPTTTDLATLAPIQLWLSRTRTLMLVLLHHCVALETGLPF